MILGGITPSREQHSLLSSYTQTDDLMPHLRLDELLRFNIYSTASHISHTSGEFLSR